MQWHWHSPTFGFWAECRHYKWYSRLMSVGDHESRRRVEQPGRKKVPGNLRITKRSGGSSALVDCSFDRRIDSWQIRAAASSNWDCQEYLNPRMCDEVPEGARRATRCLFLLAAKLTKKAPKLFKLDVWYRCKKISIANLDGKLSWIAWAEVQISWNKVGKAKTPRFFY